MERASYSMLIGRYKQSEGQGTDGGHGANSAAEAEAKAEAEKKAAAIAKCLSIPATAGNTEICEKDWELYTNIP